MNSYIYQSKFSNSTIFMNSIYLIIFINYLFFLKENDEIFSCGNNGDGQLGLGDYENRNIPEKIPNLENYIPPLNFDPFKKEKILILCLIREYIDSLIHKDYLPMDMFKLILKESKLYYDKVKYVESVYYEEKEEIKISLKKQKNEK